MATYRRLFTGLSSAELAVVDKGMVAVTIAVAIDDEHRGADHIGNALYGIDQERCSPPEIPMGIVFTTVSLVPSRTKRLPLK